MELSILIPTLNRTNFLKKILTYYSKINLNAYVYILDSSIDDIANENQILIKKINNENFKYHKIFGKSCQVQKKIMPQITTKYCVFSGDDDYFCKQGLEDTINFLNENNDFIAAHGKILHVTFENNDQNSIIDVSNYKPLGFDNCQEKSIDRLIFTFKKYQTSTFSIHRTESYMQLMSYIDENINQIQSIEMKYENIFNDELLPNFLSCCFGKNKFIDKLYMIRTSVFSPRDKNFFSQKKIYDYFTNKKGKETIKKIKKILTKEITILDKNNLFENEKIIDEEINKFIKKNYLNHKKYIFLKIQNIIIYILKKIKLYEIIKKYFKKKTYSFDIFNDKKYKNQFKIFYNFILY